MVIGILGKCLGLGYDMVYWVNVWDMSDWGMIHCTVCLWCCCLSGATYTMLRVTGGLTAYSVWCCCVSGATYTVLWVTGGLTVYSVCGVAVCQGLHTQCYGSLGV